MFSIFSRSVKTEFLIIGATWAANALENYLPFQGDSFNDLGQRSYEQVDSVADLAARLSPGAKISVPGEQSFNNSTERWSTYETPDFVINVEVAVEEDVIQTIKFANERNTPYLAVNNGHGATQTVGKVKNGIQISMRRLNSINVASDGKTATFGGGAISVDITAKLWEAEKQTVTGICECVSYIGPALGGGHGFLQGRYGLVADQFESLNLVTADGKLKKINESHELWWAIKGAGHNFGVVTSVTSKIYDVKRPKWAYAMFVFTGDKVESLYTIINERLLKNGTQDVNMINYSIFANDAEIDPSNPIINFHILQEDAEQVDDQYTAPFTALGPASFQSGAGSYRELSQLTGNGKDQIFCQKQGTAILRYPVELQQYDVPAQRKVYETYKAALKATPALNNSVALFQSYSTQGVKAVSSDITAYPFRESNILAAPHIFFNEEDSTPDLAAKAAALGTEMRDIVFKASGQEHLRVYVNYALGAEGPKEWYGAEEWRQDKLKALKRKYDPKGKFSFYNPIPVA